MLSSSFLTLMLLVSLRIEVVVSWVSSISLAPVEEQDLNCFCGRAFETRSPRRGRLLLDSSNTESLHTVLSSNDTCVVASATFDWPLVFLPLRFRPLLVTSTGVASFSRKKKQDIKNFLQTTQTKKNLVKSTGTSYD